MLGKKCHSRRWLILNRPGKSEIAIIAVVINMFRLPDLLTGENITCDNLKLLQTRQPLYYFFEKKSRLLRNNVPYWTLSTNRRRPNRPLLSERYSDKRSNTAVL